MDNKQKEQDIQKIRHTAEHVLTQAMVELYGPNNIIMAMGPATEEGFYFDFDSPEDFTFSKESFREVEKVMQKIINQNLPMIKEEVSVEKAQEIFKDNKYKQEWLRQIKDRGEKVSIYRTGDKFVDLCSGPHAESTGAIKAFKLLKVAGAYWHGDEKNKMLTRIYGTAYETKDELSAYLNMLDEAKKRDHKKLGIELDLFTFSDMVGSGLALWPPKGALLRNILDDFVWQLRSKRGYQKVEIPHITKKDLYETSGHWEKFENELFKINTREDHVFAMKPMNCPHHTQIFARKPHSYREMPQRYANTTMVYRDEQSGELSGLSRVRSITQDDAHVFCRGNQVKDEMNKIWDIIDEFYKAVGFNLFVRLSLSDPKNQSAYLGKREDWLWAEQQLRDLASERGVRVVEVEGEAAFYGPKLDFMAKDSLGREWQVATNQLDMNMPNRFGLYCINEKGEKEEIYMLHAAIMGSIERYISILIEHFSGAFPIWLSPVQTVVIPISDNLIDYANKVNKNLIENGIRSEVWSHEGSMQKRIRIAEKQRIPYMLIIGEKEKETDSVSVRRRGQVDLGVQKLEIFTNKITTEINTKTIN